MGMAELPKDPMILFSYINTQLRDHYESLEELCKSLMVEEESIRDILERNGFVYCAEQNRFR